MEKNIENGKSLNGNPELINQFYDQKKLLADIQAECLKTLRTSYEVKIQRLTALYEIQLNEIRVENEAIRNIVKAIRESALHSRALRSQEDGNPFDVYSLMVPNCKDIPQEGISLACSIPFQIIPRLINCNRTPNCRQIDSSFSREIASKVLRDNMGFHSLSIDELGNFSKAINAIVKTKIETLPLSTLTVLSQLNFSSLRNKIQNVENELKKTFLRIENCKRMTDSFADDPDGATVDQEMNPKELMELLPENNRMYKVLDLSEFNLSDDDCENELRDISQEIDSIDV